MSKLTEALNKIKVYNDYDILTKGNLMIFLQLSYACNCLPNAVTITLKGMHFKNVSYYQHGSKWITYLGKEDRDRAFKEAFEWVEEHFPGMKMVKSPFSRFSYVPETDLNKVKSLINKESSK